MQLPDLMAEEFRLPYGTAPYMAPEQVFGIRTEPRSDLFALGALMYFLATGTRPFGDPQSLQGPASVACGGTRRRRARSIRRSRRGCRRSSCAASRSIRRRGIRRPRSWLSTWAIRARFI